MSVSPNDSWSAKNLKVGVFVAAIKAKLEWADYATLQA